MADGGKIDRAKPMPSIAAGAFRHVKLVTNGSIATITIDGASESLDSLSTLILGTTSVWSGLAYVKPDMAAPCGSTTSSAASTNSGRDAHRA